MSKAIDKAEVRAQEQAQRALSAFHFAVSTLDEAADVQERLAAEASAQAAQYSDQAAFNATEAEANRARAARIRELLA